MINKPPPLHRDYNPTMENQMEKTMENEMETRECIGIIWGFTGIIVGILIIRSLKGRGLLIMGLH